MDWKLFKDKSRIKKISRSSSKSNFSLVYRQKLFAYLRCFGSYFKSGQHQIHVCVSQLEDKLTLSWCIETSPSHYLDHLK